jgi:hypothetical protein
MSPRARQILTPIAIALWVPEITDSPLRAINAQVDLGAGKIDVKHFTVLSDAFRADSRGAIPIAEVLTNSPVNLPVDFSLRRSLAKRSNLIPADASPDPPTSSYLFREVDRHVGRAKNRNRQTYDCGAAC